MTEQEIDTQNLEAEALKKAQKEAKKEEAKNETAAREALKNERLKARQDAVAAKSGEFQKDPNDPCADKFGDVEMIQSQCNPEDRFTKVYVSVKDLGEEHVGKVVRIRGRIHNSRGTGKMSFVVVREAFASVQAILSVSESVSKGMVTYASKLPKESIIEIVGLVNKPNQAIAGCSQQVEL